MNWCERSIIEEQEALRHEQALRADAERMARLKAQDEAARRKRQRLDDDIAIVEAQRDARADAYMRAIGYRASINGSEHLR